MVGVINSTQIILLIKKLIPIFNPTSLEERANTAYNIMRERKNLLTDNYSKFDTILDLLNNQLKGKKVLIVSKRGEFAAAITECLLENGIACGDYHDAAAPKAIIDEELVIMYVINLETIKVKFVFIKLKLFLILMSSVLILTPIRAI